MEILSEAIDEMRLQLGHEIFEDGNDEQWFLDGAEIGEVEVLSPLLIDLSVGPKATIGSGYGDGSQSVRARVRQAARAIDRSTRVLGVTHKRAWPSPSDEDRFAGRSRMLKLLFASEDEDMIRIRTALGSFARASLEAEPGEAFLRLAMCLEGLLVSSRENNTARVSEAASHYLGGSYATRDANRELVKDLYDARSRYVHDGQLRPTRNRNDAQLLRDSVQLVRAVLQREIRDLADPPRLIGEGGRSEHPPDQASG